MKNGFKFWESCMNPVYTHIYTYTFRIAAHTHSFSQNVINGSVKRFPKCCWNPEEAASGKD